MDLVLFVHQLLELPEHDFLELSLLIFIREAVICRAFVFSIVQGDLNLSFYLPSM